MHLALTQLGGQSCSELTAYRPASRAAGGAAARPDGGAGASCCRLRVRRPRPPPQWTVRMPRTSWARRADGGWREGVNGWSGHL
eukprot:scaffold1679_cov127-Isochrysis_galbana.AAC.2